MQGASPPLALPILWDWPQRIPVLPALLGNAQHDHAALGAQYGEHGLRKLAERRRYADDCVPRTLMEVAM